jgi:hypothetical protein
MTDEEVDLVKKALIKDAQASRPDLNSKMGDGNVKAPLTDAEKAALIKAHDLLLEDVAEGQPVRKFIQNKDVGDVLHGRTVRDGEVVPTDKMRGDIGLARNSDGLSHEETVGRLGLDYEHKPGGVDAGTAKQGQFTDVNGTGTVTVSKEVTDNGLHYIEQPMSATQAAKSQVPLAHDLYEVAQRDSVNPDRYVESPRKGGQDNPYTGTGATAPNNLEGFEAAINFW